MKRVLQKLASLALTAALVVSGSAVPTWAAGTTGNGGQPARAAAVTTGGAVTTTGTAVAYKAQLKGTVTDAGQVVSAVEIDFGQNVKVFGVEKDTFTVHAKLYVDYGKDKGQEYAYAKEADRKIVKAETAGGKVTLTLDQSDANATTLTYIADAARNYPAKLEYTITQNKDIQQEAMDGKLLAPLSKSVITCDNTVQDEETAKFTSVKSGELNYQYYAPKEKSDTLIVWFHGNGEGDILAQTGNNVSQMLANRGTVAWASDEAQKVFGPAYVMAFQAPDAWYYATTRDNLLEKAYNEIQKVVKAQGINPKKIIVSGCSAGGFMTTRMIIKYPDLFTAAMINCPALDIATLRGGEGATPTDEELAAIKNSDTSIWLVQGETDSSVAPDNCSKRLFKALTDGQELTSTEGKNEVSSSFTTQETKDGKYKLTLYKTTDLEEKAGTLGDKRQMGKIIVSEDYNLDGVQEPVKYNDHWTWIYTLRNNPSDASGKHIWEWAAAEMNKKLTTAPAGEETKPGQDETKPGKEDVQPGGDETQDNEEAIAAAKAAKVKGLKVTAKKAKAIVSWKEVADASQYQVFTATKKNGKFKKAATTSKLKATIKKLKKGKTYFVKVRCITSVDGQKVKGKFSAVKKVTIKK